MTPFYLFIPQSKQCGKQCDELMWCDFHKILNGQLHVGQSAILSCPARQYMYSIYVKYMKQVFSTYVLFRYANYPHIIYPHNTLVLTFAHA